MLFTLSNDFFLCKEPQTQKRRSYICDTPY